MFHGVSLLDRSLEAARGAAAVVVVGPDTGVLPERALHCREDPPFAGPAAAVGAGLAALAQAGITRPFTLVLACDMPNIEPAVRALSKALQPHEPMNDRRVPGPGNSAGSSRDAHVDGVDGVMAVSADGRRQPLVGFYSTPALRRSVQDLASRGALVNGSMTALLASLDVQLVTVPAGSTDDVDTWDDAAALGVASQEP
jgi:molybdopterin-guanine dinucleotide biosynthesis protein A